MNFKPGISILLFTFLNFLLIKNDTLAISPSKIAEIPWGCTVTEFMEDETSYEIVQRKNILPILHNTHSWNNYETINQVTFSDYSFSIEIAPSEEVEGHFVLNPQMKSRTKEGFPVEHLYEPDSGTLTVDYWNYIIECNLGQKVKAMKRKAKTWSEWVTNLFYY